MEKFLFLFRGGEHHNPSLPKEALQAHVKKMMDWIGTLSKEGIYVGGNALERSGKQVNGSKKTITDGPFVEAKEIIGGFIIVNAKDINAAVEISKGCPNLDTNGILEVRQIQAM
jgi:hypothetical protein